MKHLPLIALLLAGCSASQNAAVDRAFASPPGALFCSIQMAGGGAFVANLTATALTGAAPGAGPLVVIATNAGKQAVDDDCAKGARAIAGAVSGVPVSPPVNAVNVPQVAIVAPASPVVVVK